MTRTSTVFGSLIALASIASAEPALVKVEVFPADINLNTKRDRQMVVVQASYADGTTRDVTKEAKFTFAHPDLVQLTGAVVHPAKDGKTELTVAFAGQTLKVPVEVKDSAADRPISFKLDIMPVLQKGGCNTGDCHGAARGKDGFRLSLFGFDPDGDYFRLTREVNGRRINLAEPKESLVLLKALGEVDHTGGQRFTEDTELYDSLLRWHAAGAPKDADNVAKPTSIEIYPQQMVLEGAGTTQQLMVRAKYNDGTDRDVTHLTTFITNNEMSAAIEGNGVVKAGERGEAFIMARFDAFNEVAQALIIPKGLKFNFPSVKEHNYIDTHVNNKLKKLRIEPSETCTDEEFLRRAFVDIVGELPKVAEYSSFLADANPNKRAKLIDELLERKEFVEIWVMKFAELLQIRTVNNRTTYKSTLLYFNWLQEQIANDVPMDEIVKQLLCTSGGVFKNPASNYYQSERDTLKIAENVAQVFMGMRIQCAQCHNHPFDRWTVDDYYSFAAFFSQIGRKPGEDPREEVIFNSGGGEVRHLVDKRVMAPKYLGGQQPEVKGQDRRAVLASWLASPENPFFATNLANIVWQHFTGKGIVDPVDDVRISNPPSNPELLDTLGKKFTEYKYDFKHLVRDICNSRTYQLSTKTNESNKLDSRNFAHAEIRRIRAEVLLDCITQITDTRDKFPRLPLGARAVQIADGQISNYFLTTFGRATRETVCSCEVKMEPNLSQALHLLNGDTVNQKVQSGGLVKTRLAEKKSPEQIIEEIYVRCYTRKPTPDEVSKLMAIVKADNTTQQTLEDAFWALMNAKEFFFNH